MRRSGALIEWFKVRTACAGRSRMISVTAALALLVAALAQPRATPALAAGTTLTVTSASDADCASAPTSNIATFVPQTLRCAVTWVNQDFENNSAAQSPYLVNFNIPVCPSNICVIQPQHADALYGGITGGFNGGLTLQADHTTINGYSEHAASTVGGVQTQAVPNSCTSYTCANNAVIEIQLDGGAQNCSSGYFAGLTIMASNTLVEGLAITGFQCGDGLLVDPTTQVGTPATTPQTGNVIQGNFIGPDATGNSGASRNGQQLFLGGGILLDTNSTSSTVGGAPCTGAEVTGPCLAGGFSAAQYANENVIGGNNDWGVGALSSDANTIEGNNIGANLSGNGALGNSLDGILLFDGVTHTQVLGNLISGNSGRDGIELGCNNTTATTDQHNVIAGNLIGTTADGIGKLSNNVGIQLSDSFVGFNAHFCANDSNSRPQDNIIGGSAGGPTGTVFGFSSTDGNIISGNATDQVLMYGTTNNVVTGNYIGVGVDGKTVVDPTYGARAIVMNSGNAQDSSNVIGVGSTGTGSGTLTATKGNVISGNFEGVTVTTSVSDIIAGNIIGLASDGVSSSDGLHSTGNTGEGINFRDGASSVTIGGTTSAARNIISNNNFGIYVLGTASSNNIKGNYIGTDSSGTLARGNNQDGVFIGDAASNQVGGLNAGDGNVISANGRNGIRIDADATSSSPSELVKGNFIGVKAGVSGGTSGTPLGSLGNGLDGIFLRNVHGGDNDVLRGNTVGGNQSNGIEVGGLNTGANSGVVIAGNFIGTSASHGQFPNAGDGVYVYNGLTGVTVGGSTNSGVCDTDCNAITFNARSGIEVGSSPTDSTQVAILGNAIHDNMTTSPSPAGTEGEIYLSGLDPANCGTANVAGNPNAYLPCPTNLSLSGTTASVSTCSGCQVDFYTFHTGANDSLHPGSVEWLGSTTATGSACTFATSGTCTNTVTASITVPAGIAGFTATASDPVVTSEFGAAVGAGATYAPATRFTAVRHGASVMLRWHMRTSRGLLGFNIFAGSHRLNRTLIRPHRGASYHYLAPWSGTARFTLRVLHPDGSSSSFTVH
jgi:hypothetical protein